MKLSHFAPLGATLAFVLATPVMAQDSTGAVDWTGPYIGGSFGYNWQKGDGEEHLRFDTDADGDYDDVVRTGTGANAFSPGTCGGSARGSTPASGCNADKDAIGWMGHVATIANSAASLPVSSPKQGRLISVTASPNIPPPQLSMK